MPKISGERAYGEHVVLLHQHDNLISNTSWGASGYTVAPLFSDHAEFDSLRKGLTNIFIEGIKSVGIIIPSGFQVEKYHSLINDNQALHLEVINQTKLIQIERFPTNVQNLVNRVSEIVGVNVTPHNPQTNEQVFHLRIVRPGRTDFNPLHRDVWLDIYRGCVNIYVPVAGSTISSSLPLVPGSHFWPESQVERTLKGAIMDGAKYHVPGLTNAINELDLVRPNPLYNEALVFSPYLIHGEAVNLNNDDTRVSLEMRFWRK